ncbi:histidine--tRNA ligase [Candidatus Pandoraea novymonadis]|uniref:Histidine--tRNA ligase n=1 Tax=Candidatus Pandoraea novymonadis TaxID=1808959 RepID=A0ABX5FFC6_9BURK|nr:histidine--tRNA ligase [Candidatus Pandoraea novymonadis]PSB91932.1 Histidine-tRNA ligase [Candidatus Pandoraea novymonadis]
MCEAKQDRISRLTGIKGMNDILPQDESLWDFFEETVRAILRAYGYQHIRTPILEQTQLFLHGLGQVTDIVEKEMYSFTDILNGQKLTMRPENTAAVVRAALEHNLLYSGPQRLWYFGPMFRHEKPQRGRYRQFHQLGLEALGFAGPDVDVEIILICQRLWDDLGLTGIHLELNSLGQAEERAVYRQDLMAYFENHIEYLDEDSKRRLYTNPLRILDSKNPAIQLLLEGAPQLINYLGASSKQHFEEVQSLLKANNVPFKINPHLIRGLDYYNLTVFEWITDKLGAQGTVAGGGRYDSLIEQLGGDSTPACGWAIGVERILELLREAALVPQMESCDVYVVHHGEMAVAPALIAAERMRDAGLNVLFHCSPAGKSSSFKSQMKRADSSRAAFAVIFGENEVIDGAAVVKHLRATNEKNNQTRVAFDMLTEYLMDAIVSSAKRPVNRTAFPQEVRETSNEVRIASMESTHSE